MLKREIAAYGKDAAIFTELTKQHMNHAQDEADKHSRSIELERRRLEELEKQLALATSRVRSQPLPPSRGLFLMWMPPVRGSIWELPVLQSPAMTT